MAGPPARREALTAAPRLALRCLLAGALAVAALTGCADEEPGATPTTGTASPSSTSTEGTGDVTPDEAFDTLNRDIRAVAAALAPELGDRQFLETPPARDLPCGGLEGNVSVGIRPDGAIQLNASTPCLPNPDSVDF